MQAALIATLAHPAWWAVALAAFLVRGGFLVVLLPIVSLPSTAALATQLAPPVEALVLGGPTLEGTLVSTVLVTLVLLTLGTAGVAGSWLDLALLREAAHDDELDMGWSPRRMSPRVAFAVRLTAHLPTLVALGYATMRLVAATYAEFLEPGEPSLPLVERVLGRAPDAVLLVVVTWLAGETVGALAARRIAAGEPSGVALRGALRQVAGRRGLATLALTTAVVLAVLISFVLAAGAAWVHLRAALYAATDAPQLVAALLLFVSTWILGLALLGAALAWRATAWTLQVAPAQIAPEAAPAAPEAARG